MSPDKVAVPKEKLQAFIQELNGFAETAESTLKKIEDNKGENKGLFSVFSERMIAIRGTAMQLSLDDIAHIAGLGEEIAIKGTTAESNRQIRKCVGSLWDALTTVKYMLEHYEDELDDTQKILINRLEKTIEAFGGARPTVGEDEIAALLGKRN